MILPVIVVLVVLGVAAAAHADTRRWKASYETSGEETFPRRFTEDSAGRVVLWARRLFASARTALRSGEVAGLTLHVDRSDRRQLDQSLSKSDVRLRASSVDTARNVRKDWQPLR